MFLSGYDVRKYTSDKDTVAPMANNFVIPQIEFCCSNGCFVKFSSTMKFEEDPPEPSSEDGMAVDWQKRRNVSTAFIKIVYKKEKTFENNFYF